MIIFSLFQGRSFNMKGMTGRVFSSYLTLLPNGVRLRVRAKPRSRGARQRAPRVVELTDGPALEIAVAAAPEGGKANKELLAFLAAWCDVPQGAVILRTGDTARLKLIDVGGEAAALAARLAVLLEG